MPLDIVRHLAGPIAALGIAKQLPSAFYRGAHQRHIIGPDAFTPAIGSNDLAWKYG